MRSVEDIKKEIEDLKKKTLSNRISESDKQICRDKIKQLTFELRQESGDIEKKVVPVETNNIIAHRHNVPKSRFMSSAAFRI